jgi:hypothetical protein
MVLQTDFVKIVGRRTQRGVFSLAFVPDNLGKRAVNDFFRLQFYQRFDIIARTEPLTCRHFVVVADKFLGHGDGIIYDFNLFGTEAVSFWHIKTSRNFYN